VSGSAEHKAHQNIVDQNIGGLQNKLNELSNTINEQNASIAQLHLQLNDLTISNQDKQKALDKALAEIANNNADLATTHDEIVDAQKPTEQPKEAPKKRSLFTRIILLGLLFNKKK
jgi:phage shock protein A